MSLRLAPDVVVRLAVEPVDFRRSIDGLARAVALSLGRDPVSREVFLFTNRRRTSIKALYWSGNGFVLLYKRLEKRRFRWPRHAGEALDVQLAPAVFEDLLEGLTRHADTHAIMPQSQSTTHSSGDRTSP